MEREVEFSNICEIDSFIKTRLLDLKDVGYEIVETRNINYGTRVKFEKHGLFFHLTFYYSKKKGISIVKDQNVDLILYQELIDIFENRNRRSVKDNKESIAEASIKKYNISLNDSLKNNKIEISFSKWIGTDEAGKGDYFGPLVVAGFFLDKDIEKDLVSLGIKDSKNISDNKIEEIFNILDNDFKDYYSVKVFLPREYNDIINEYKKQGKTLNDLLGFAHSIVINDLYKRHKNVEGIIVDQFTHQDKVHCLIKGHIEASYIQKPRAESDIAVAAASVVARAVFLGHLKDMGERYGTVFPKGASNQLIKWAIEFYKEHGELALYDLAKIHFKTTASIVNSINK